MNEQLINFDPNLNYCGRMAKKVVRMTFGLWEYRLTVEKTIGGNCSGLDNFSAAIEIYYDDVLDTGIVLVDASGETLLTMDEEDKGAQWLADMLIAAEIISVTADRSNADE